MFMINNYLSCRYVALFANDEVDEDLLSLVNYFVMYFGALAVGIIVNTSLNFRANSAPYQLMANRVNIIVITFL